MKAVENTSNSNRIAKNTIYLYLRMFLIMAVNLYTSRVVLNALGVVDYGVYNVVGGVVSMFGFLNSALAQATQRYIAFGIGRDSIEKQRQTFSMLLNVHMLIATLVVILCETIGLWFLYNKMIIPENRLTAAFWVMQCSIATSAINITQVPYNASIFGHERMNVYAYISILEVLLKLVAVLSLLYFFSDKMLSYAFMILSVGIIVASVYRIYCVHTFQSCHYVLCWSKKLFKDVFGFTSWSLIGNLAWTFNGQGMNVLINLFFGPVFNAARGIAASVESAITSFLYNFLGASVPQIIKSYASGDISYMKKLCFKSSKFGFLLFMCLSLPIMSILNGLLKIWLINPPELSSLLCALSLIYIQCNSMSGTLQNVIQATGHVRNFQLTNGLLKLSALPMVYILYKFGAPIATYLVILIAVSLLGMLIQLRIVNKEIKDIKIGEYLKFVTLHEIAAYFFPLVLALWLWEHTFGVGGSILVAAGMLMFCLLMSWTLGLVKHEREWIAKIVQSKIYIIVKKKR